MKKPIEHSHPYDSYLSSFSRTLYSDHSESPEGETIKHTYTVATMYMYYIEIHFMLKYFMSRNKIKDARTVGLLSLHAFFLAM